MKTKIALAVLIILAAASGAIIADSTPTVTSSTTTYAGAGYPAPPTPSWNDGYPAPMPTATVEPTHDPFATYWGECKPDGSGGWFRNRFEYNHEQRSWYIYMEWCPAELIPTQQPTPVYTPTAHPEI